MKQIILPGLTILIALISFRNTENENDSVIAKGQMPALTRDESGNIHLVYGSNDSILYSHSSDKGSSFSSPIVVSILPKLAASHMRGPQIAITSNGIVITACTNSGDIFSFSKSESGQWIKAAKVNDVDTVAKENLMSLAASGQTAFAVWLDLRDKHNKIYGAKSTDLGKTWSKNILIYESPDSTVCECCKPTIVIKNNQVYIMFRNWINGNRDLYFIQSNDGGNSFGKAQKLGYGTWALNGCPMDGGNMVIGKNGNLQTVWNRKGKIYACEAGKEEVELGKGRSCTMQSVNDKNVYAWVEDGNVIVMKPQGMKKNLGKGQLPVIKAVNDRQILCVWENEKEIHSALVEL